MDAIWFICLLMAIAGLIIAVGDNIVLQQKNKRLEELAKQAVQNIENYVFDGSEETETYLENARRIAKQIEDLYK